MNAQRVRIGDKVCVPPYLCVYLRVLEGYTCKCVQVSACVFEMVCLSKQHANITMPPPSIRLNILSYSSVKSTVQHSQRMP